MPLVFRSYRPVESARIRYVGAGRTAILFTQFLPLEEQSNSLPGCHTEKGCPSYVQHEKNEPFSRFGKFSHRFLMRFSFPFLSFDVSFVISKKGPFGICLRELVLSWGVWVTFNRVKIQCPYFLVWKPDIFWATSTLCRHSDNTALALQRTSGTLINAASEGTGEVLFDLGQ
jgi:hypothetical protein